MKSNLHLLSLLISAVLACACSKEMNAPNYAERAPADAKHGTVVTIEEAEQEVLSLINAIDPKTRNGEPIRKISNSFSKRGTMETKTDGTQENSPLVHIFNFEDNRGFAIVAGDRRVSPVLCLADEGQLSPDDVIDNPGFLIAMSRLDTYYRIMTRLPITDADGNTVTAEEYTAVLGLDPVTPILPPDEYSYEYGEWEDLSTTGSILPCKWNQEAPFNNNCTDTEGNPAYVGCVAVAVGQIMYHWGKNYTYKDTYWDWNKMRYVVNDKSSPYGTEAWDLVQRLLYVVGLPENLDMDYNAAADTVGSAASGSNVCRTFEHFGYISGGELEDYDWDRLKENLAYGPVYGQGYSIKKVKTYNVIGLQVGKKTTYHNGHAWVYDQVLEQRRLVKEYLNYELNRTYYETRKFVHVNWGWGGSKDGYYLSGAYNTNSGPALTRGTKYYGIDYYYQYKLEMNCGIRAY